MSCIVSRVVFLTLLSALQLAACGDGYEDGSSMSHQNSALTIVAANESGDGESPIFE